MAEQTKSSLFLYMETNRTFIEEKIYNDFNVQCLTQKQIKVLDVKRMARNIREIFDFGKTKSYEVFFQKLEPLIDQYIQEQYKRKAAASFLIIDIDKLYDIIIYCIKHGFEDQKEEINVITTNTNPTSPPKQQPLPKPIEKPVEVQIQKPKVVKKFYVEKVVPRQVVIPKFESVDVKDVKPRISSFLQKDKIPQKKEFKIQKYPMPQKNVGPKYLSSIPKAPAKEDSTIQSRIIQPLNPEFLDKNKKELKDRLQKLYNHYCSQQQHLGRGPTFDRIQSQCSKMSIGNFLLFCKSTSLFAQAKEIKKDTIMSAFKKIAEGRSLIEFEDFYAIITQLDRKYEQSCKKQSKQQIPTFQARLQLHQKKSNEMKKFNHYIFSSGKQETRELTNLTNEQFKTRKLTSHSGKFSQDLKAIVKDKDKESAKSPSDRYVQNQNVVHLSNLNTSKLPKIDWIVEEDADDMYLSDYKINAVVDKARKRVIQTERQKSIIKI